MCVMTHEYSMYHFLQMKAEKAPFLKKVVEGIALIFFNIFGQSY